MFHHSGFTETIEKSHVIHHDHLLLNLGLLLNVVLSTPLLRLAGVMLMLILGLLGAVSRQACDSTSDGACNPISCPRGEVANLATSLLLLSLEVLLTSGLLQVLPNATPVSELPTRPWAFFSHIPLTRRVRRQTP